MRAGKFNEIAQANEAHDARRIILWKWKRKQQKKGDKKRKTSKKRRNLKSSVILLFSFCQTKFLFFPIDIFTYLMDIRREKHTLTCFCLFSLLLLLLLFNVIHFLLFSSTNLPPLHGIREIWILFQSNKTLWCFKCPQSHTPQVRTARTRSQQRNQNTLGCRQTLHVVYWVSLHRTRASGKEQLRNEI